MKVFQCPQHTLTGSTHADAPLHLSPQARQPAWLMSMGLHALLVLLLALFAVPSVTQTIEDHERRVGIVLAHGDQGQQREYFAADGSPAEQQADSKQSLQPSESALPDAADDAQINRQRQGLPEQLGGIVPTGDSGNGLVQTATLDAARQRRTVAGGDDASILDNDALRNPQPGPVGPKAEVSIFGVSGEGRSFVFLIDRSNSMGDRGLGALTAAEHELALGLVQLKPVHRFGILAYNNRLLYFSPQRMLPASDANKELAGKFLGGLVAAAGTQHEMGLTAALRLSPDVIFILTDGDEPGLSDSQLAGIARRAGSTTAIHAIHFGYGASQDRGAFLKKLAGSCKGTYRYVDMSKR